ncbi:hypothetical protein Hdeb2414_s0005g00161001 [Helianthus debilis subsp. tardiflorus]
MCLGGQNSSCSKFHSNFKFYSFRSRVSLSLSFKSTFVSLFPYPLLHPLETLKIAAPHCTHKQVQSMGKRSREKD